jgi:TRAP-type C4-dicarboxylate transport system substrate-binding protein
MRTGALAALSCAAVALAGCGGGSSAHVLRMASADPAGIAHDPAVGYFVERVTRLSGGRLRVAPDERWARDGSEAGLLRDVAGGKAPLGWAHTRAFGAIGVRSFDAIDAPQLLDSYAVQAAVVRGRLARRMLAGVEGAGLRGLALLAGPLSRPIGTSTPLSTATDFAGLAFGVHRSPVADLAVRALHAHPVAMTLDNVTNLYTDVVNHPGPPAALEDDLDAAFFDRYGGACNAHDGPCATARPWVTSNVVLWPRAAALVANPGALAGLTAVERSWLTRAAADAARYAPTAADHDRRLAAELCASGVRFTTASPAALATLRRAWRPVYARLERRAATAAAIRQIAALRRRAPAPAPLPTPSPCRQRPPAVNIAHGLPSSLPDGVYRIRTTVVDVRTWGAEPSGYRPGTETLTLRDGRWRLEITEPGRYVEEGTYAGRPLRTAWLNDRHGIRDESFFSIVADHDGLTFHVARSGDPEFYTVAFASHRWRRIGD